MVFGAKASCDCKDSSTLIIQTIVLLLDYCCLQRLGQVWSLTQAAGVVIAVIPKARYHLSSAAIKNSFE